ncbi:MAG: glycosyltransferase family 2 protein [Nanoarchaeota archaeon]|nr:glycosyltransferase family 2 protein [Nanoarchaeota archaeon]
MISVLVLTKNEEKNLGTCLKSVEGLADEIIIVDSFSTDTTKDIAKMYGARFYEHAFENQADQVNWALGNVEIKGDWILRLDADEYLTPELAKEIKKTLLNAPQEISGYEMKRRVYFLGKWVRHGGYYPTWHLRLWRRGKGAYEEREVDEHLELLEGGSGRMKHDFVDDNKKGLGAWIEKHNTYAEREARETLKGNFQLFLRPRAQDRGATFNLQLYYRLPIFWRARLYYFYRLILRGGFLDGREGRLFHFLQGYWYRMLTDAKIYESRRDVRHPQY